jgi:hypothetical protein
MRFRLGLLQDTKEIEKQIAKDAADAQKPPTVKTEAETKRAEARAKDPDREKLRPKKPKIKPLPEAKAIELGANFVSETFLLAVGIALILFENARRGRQETKKDEGQLREIEELKKTVRLQTQALKEVEKEILRPRSKDATPGATSHRILPEELREPEDEEKSAEPRPTGWLSWVPSLFRTNNNDGSQPKQPTMIRALDAQETARPAPYIPTPYTSILSRIVSSPHARDVNTQATNLPADASPTNTSQSASEQPKENLSASSQEQ